MHTVHLHGSKLTKVIKDAAVAFSATQYFDGI